MIFGFISNIFIMLCNVPQLIKLLKTKNSLGISMNTYILLFIGAVCMTIYGFKLHAIPIYGIGIYDILSSSLTIFFINKYSKNDLYSKTFL